MVIRGVYNVLLIPCIDCDFSCRSFSYSVNTCFGCWKPGLDSFSRQSEFACGAGRNAICVTVSKGRMDFLEDNKFLFFC